MLKKNNLQLFFLLSVFLLPLVISYFLYFAHIQISGKTTQHGILINPPLHISAWVPAEKKWQMIYVAKFCDQRCKQWLFSLQQIQKALGKDHERVTVSSRNVGWIKERSDVSTISLVDSRRGESNAKDKPAQVTLNPPYIASSPNVRDDTVIFNRIYFVDPIGNVFMYYPDTTDPMNILKDMKHVLGVSQIG